MHRKPNGEWFGEEAQNELATHMHEACQEPAVVAEVIDREIAQSVRHLTSPLAPTANQPCCLL
ncbi:MAG TPA: hypothetical protein DDX19_11500 [Rhodopirellula baltica]|nr:hypothetical protein [Rhodopirellula baltica]